MRMLLLRRSVATCRVSIPPRVETRQENPPGFRSAENAYRVGCICARAKETERPVRSFALTVLSPPPPSSRHPPVPNDRSLNLAYMLVGLIDFLSIERTTFAIEDAVSRARRRLSTSALERIPTLAHESAATIVYDVDSPYFTGESRCRLSDEN